MIIIRITFTTGRYYATSWVGQSGKTTEWPPSPYRLLRAIIASWKYNMSHIDEEKVFELVRMLASELPEFHLPPIAFGREHDGIPACKDRGMKTGTYGMINKKEPVQIIWPDLDMNRKKRRILRDILENIRYFGRTKSWCSITLDCNARTPNCVPQFKNAGSRMSGHNTRIAVVSPKQDIAMDDLYTTRDNVRKKEGMHPDGSQMVPYIRYDIHDIS